MSGTGIKDRTGDGYPAESVSADHVADIVRRYYAYIDKADFPRAVRLFAPNATYRRPGYPVLRGRSVLLAFYQDTRMIRSGRHELHTVMVDGPMVAVAGTFAGTIADDEYVTQDFADFFTVRNGLIVARQTYFDSPAI